jgi:ribosomal protein S18 acetylase RimI-like enzyme
MMPLLGPLTPAHAADAARLHILGQPGTFLTNLGPEVLTVLYRALPRSLFGLGYAVTDGDTKGPLLGFVGATTSVAALFLEMGTLRLPEFGPPLLRALGDRPALLPRAAETLLYPLLATRDGAPDTALDDAALDHAPGAELLSIMVQPQARGQGIGAVLLQVLAEECQRRGVARLDVTVDAANTGARRFYARHGFTQRRTFTLYGRAMCLYALELAAEVLP